MIKRMYKTIFFSKFSMLIISCLGQIVDMIIVGRFYGPSAMAAISICLPLNSIIVLFANVITLGCETTCSRSIGKNDTKKVASQLGISAVVSTAYLFVAVGIVYIFLEPISILLGAANDPAIQANFLDYIKTANIFLFTRGLVSLFIYIAQLNNRGRHCVVANAVFICTNIGLDLANVYIFNLGLTGIGLATAVSYFLYLVILYASYKTAKTPFKIKLRGLDFKMILPIIRVGLSNVLITGCINLQSMAVNWIALNFLDPSAISALSVMNSISSILICVANALGFSTNMIAGFMYGERNTAALKRVIKAFVQLSIVFNLILGILVFIFTEQLVSLYYSSIDTTFYLSIDFVRIFVFGLVFDSIDYCFLFFYLATKNKRQFFIITLFLNLICIPVALLCLLPILHEYAIPYSYTIGYILTLLYIIISSCIKSKKSPFNPEAYLFLTKDFYIPEENVLFIKVHTKDKLEHLKDDIEKFCDKFNAEDDLKRNIFYITNVFASNVVKYGIPSNLKIQQLKHNLYIQIIYNNNIWKIWMRDNCKQFNPTEYIKYNESNDISTAIDMADKLEYKNIVGFNVLEVEIRD